MEETKEAVKEEGTFKIKKKKKPRKLVKKNEPIKIDLSVKKEEPKDAISESGTGNVDEAQSATSVAEVVEEVRGLPPETTPETKPSKEVVSTTNNEKEEISIIQEISNEVEDTATQEIVEDIKEELQENPQLELPENVEKLIDFMKDTGGSLVDYVRLNADYSQVNNDIILKEYYLHTKPHLDSEEIEFLMNDNFNWDEDVDEERDIRKKQLALKEEVAKARNHLDGLKSKYYEDLKLRPTVTNEHQKAMEFFNRYNKDQEVVRQQHESFKNTTKKFFTEDFKGFDFNLGEKKFRYGVTNPNEVADTQSNLSDFIKKFLDEKGNIVDYTGYHKAIYAARNADTIAQHFYQQGQADAIKDITAKSKNISNEPRTTSSGDVYINGLKVKAISGADGSKLKIKKRKFNT